MSSKPVLGSAALQLPPATSQKVHVSPSTCHNLSMFKELMKEYRRIDDTIIMRINRNNATFRDRDRVAGTSGRGQASMQDEACAYFWKELVATWKGRAEIIDYCVQVVDQQMDETREALKNPELDPKSEDPVVRREQRRRQALLYSDEVKRNQIHSEMTVEKIVRNRSLEGDVHPTFTSRCRFFQPPLTDKEARRWWEAAQSAR